MKYDTTLPLVDQLADAAMASRDPTTRSLFTVVRGNLDDHVEQFFLNPTGDNLTDLIGYWTRAVQLLRKTPDVEVAQK
jgi:hypothetical protein